MKWKFIGCKIEDVPKELLSDETKSEEEIKNLLYDVPIEEGELDADSIEELAKILIDNGVYPIKIKEYDDRDHKINKLRSIHNVLKKKEDDKKIIKKSPHKNPVLANDVPNKFILFYKQIVFAIVVIILIILAIYGSYDAYRKYFSDNNPTRNPEL